MIRLSFLIYREMQQPNSQSGKPHLIVGRIKMKGNLTTPLWLNRILIFQGHLGPGGLLFEVTWEPFFKLSSLGLDIYEFVFHIIRCQNATLQISKRKQVSEFSFEDGKVIFVLNSEAILVDLSWIFLKVFCYLIFGLVFPYLLLPITVLARPFHITNYKIAPLYYKTDFFTYCLIYVYCWYAKFYILYYMEEEKGYLYCCKIITWKSHYWFKSLCML